MAVTQATLTSILGAVVAFIICQRLNYQIDHVLVEVGFDFLVTSLINI